MAQDAIALNRKTNKPIRELLRFYGLRTSLIRLKVIDALLVAAWDGRAIGVHGVLAYLESSAAEWSFISVREVLKRLCDVGVIHYQADRSYSFTAEACEILMQNPG
nr:fe2+ zn2+ uptake regulation protein [Pseudomonas sp. WPR_5_2]